MVRWEALFDQIQEFSTYVGLHIFTEWWVEPYNVPLSFSIVVADSGDCFCGVNLRVYE